MFGHSPLGFSGAHRWMACPGSPHLIATLPPGSDPVDPDYRVAGTAAHAAWAWCLREGAEAWEAGDREWEGYQLTAEDMDAGQVYLDLIHHHQGDGHGDHFIEEACHAPEFHPLAYGTLDHILIDGDTAVLTDYKHGEGLWVDVVRNPQLMGYAVLALSRWPQIEQFQLRICQPRCKSSDGEPTRTWDVSAEEIKEWAAAELLPAMIRAGAPQGELVAGEHCRFCPAKLACPKIREDASTFTSSAPLAERMSDEALGSLYEKLAQTKMLAKAVEAEVYRRMMAGSTVPGSKVVVKKAWRVWKDGAAEALEGSPVEEIYKTELKTPAEIEKMGPEAKRLVREWAYTPDAGYTVAPLSDSRKAVTPPAGSMQKFAEYVDTAEVS